MKDSEFILKLLDINQPMAENPTRFSTLALLLTSGRKLFGCNLETGKYELNEVNDENFIDKTYHSFQFTALINYLILLEQIGSIFIKKNGSKIKETNGIFCALTYFSSLTDTDKIEAIQALRNSLVHKFGLATEKKPHKMPPRKFILSIARNSEIVEQPKSDWDGTFSDKSDETSTTIFIADLIILIETVYQNVIQENKNGNVEMILKDGMSELESRYTFIY